MERGGSTSTLSASANVCGKPHAVSSQLVITAALEQQSTDALNKSFMSITVNTSQHMNTDVWQSSVSDFLKETSKSEQHSS